MIGQPDWIDRLGIRFPIIQAPMAGVSTPAMAAAVSDAGALGSIAIGSVEPTIAARMIVEVRQRTRQPFNVNLFCHRPARTRPDVEQQWIARLRPEFTALGAPVPSNLREIYRTFRGHRAMLNLLLDARPAVISFHFGLPDAATVAALRRAGAVLIATATNADEARAIAAAGLDGIVAQGWEAGGHRGCFDPDAADEQLGTLGLTRLIAAETKLPVIAAGGIMDGAAISAALQAGARAVQLGTAFVACVESAADESHREALRESGERGTVMTRAISGRPARSVANAMTHLGADVTEAEVPDYPIAYDLAKRLHKAAMAVGDHRYGAHWAGTGAARDTPSTTADVIATLVAELEACRS